MSVHTAAGKICNSHTNTPSLKQMPSCSTTKYLQVCKFSLSCTLENPLITMQRQCTFCTGQLRNGECCSLALNSIQSSGAGEAHATKLVPAIPHRLISYEMRQIWNHSSCDWVTICFASLEQLSEGSYIYIYFFSSQNVTYAWLHERFVGTCAHHDITRTLHCGAYTFSL